MNAPDTVTINSRDPAQQGLANQLNAQAGHIGISPKGQLPTQTTPFSLISRSTSRGGIVLHQTDSKGRPLAGLHFSKALTLYTGLTTSAGAPTLADLPVDGSYGWHLDTSATAYYWAYNDAGTIVYPDFASVSGSLDFTRLTGTISATQHGNVTGTGPFHAFTAISGVITDTQHGARGNISGTAHDVVVAGGFAGFMIGADKTKLDAYPPSATSVYNDSNCVRRASGVINVSDVNVNGTRVVTARQTGWGAPTGTSDRTTFATSTVTLQELAQRVKALLEDLGSIGGHGLISTV